VTRGVETAAGLQADSPCTALRYRRAVGALDELDPQQRHEVQLIGGPAAGAPLLGHVVAARSGDNSLVVAPSWAGAHLDAQLALGPCLRRRVVMGAMPLVIAAHSTSRDGVMAVEAPASRPAPASTLS
jgi:hypothetical protein